MSTVNAEAVIAALENIADRLEGKTLASVKVATVRRSVSSLIHQVKNQAVPESGVQPELPKEFRPGHTLHGTTTWSVLDTETHVIYPQPNRLIADKVAEMHRDCIVVPGWPAHMFKPEKPVDLLDLTEVEYNRAAQAFYEATSESLDIVYSNMLAKPTIVMGLRAAVGTVVR